MAKLLPHVETLRLVDHHCHQVLARDLDRPGFEAMLTETGSAGPAGSTLFDSRVGFAVRRWCAPVLDLPAHAPADEYLARRTELGHAEVTGRFMAAAGLGALLLDNGFRPDPAPSDPELGAAAGASTHEIVRLEQVAEQVAAAGTGAAGFAAAVRDRLADRGRHAVGFKSVAAYRVGLALSGERPTGTRVTQAAGRWLDRIDAGAPVRLADEVLHRFLVWCAVEHGLPIQFHTGFGDRDLDLHRTDPLLLTDLLRAIEPTGVPVMLLHTYPYHRQAGYLAQVYPHVFVDIGLATHNAGRRAGELLAELLELAPFGKVLFSSDAGGLPELYLLAALLFRQALSGLLAAGVADGDWTAPDAARLARMIGADNARRIYKRLR